MIERPAFDERPSVRPSVNEYNDGGLNDDDDDDDDDDCTDDDRNVDGRASRSDVGWV